MRKDQTLLDSFFARFNFPKGFPKWTPKRTRLCLDRTSPDGNSGESRGSEAETTTNHVMPILCLYMVSHHTQENPRLKTPGPDEGGLLFVLVRLVRLVIS